MKKLLLLACLCALLVLSFASCSCEETVEVKFESYIGADIGAQEIEIGGLVSEPTAKLSRAGYTFKGWYSGDKKWDFESDTVSKDLTLTAKWELYLSFVEVEGELWIGGCDLLDTAVVEIPREHNGRAVVGILPFAFADRKKIESVYIPDTVKEIKEGAFFGCTMLEKIYCEAEAQPSGWSDNIENSGAEFVFGHNKQ